MLRMSADVAAAEQRCECSRVYYVVYKRYAVSIDSDVAELTRMQQASSQLCSSNRPSWIYRSAFP